MSQHPSPSTSGQPPSEDESRRRGPIASVHRWLFDFENKQGFAARIDYGIAVLILASVAAILLEHVEPVYTPYARWFHAFEWVLVIVFTLEYLLRLLTAPLSPEFAKSRFPRLRYQVAQARKS